MIKHCGHQLQFDGFGLDTSLRTLFRNGEPVQLPPKAFDTLLVLVRNNGRIVDRRELIQSIWPDTFVEPGNLTLQIHTVRKALGANPQGGEYVETFSKRGYRFSASVIELSDEIPEIASASEAAPRPAALTLAYLVIGVILVVIVMLISGLK